MVFAWDKTMDRRLKEDPLARHEVAVAEYTAWHCSGRRVQNSQDRDHLYAARREILFGFLNSANKRFINSICRTANRLISTNEQSTKAHLESPVVTIPRIANDMPKNR